MVSIFGYLYAWPMSEDDCQKMNAMIDRDFVAATLTLYPIVSTEPGSDLFDLNIANSGRPGEERFFEEWERNNRPYDGKDFLWRNQAMCRPPLRVARAAERLIEAIRLGDQIALGLCQRVSNDWLSPNMPEEWGKDDPRLPLECINELRALANACEFAANVGAKEITLYSPLS